MVWHTAQFRAKTSGTARGAGGSGIEARAAGGDELVENRVRGRKIRGERGDARIEAGKFRGLEPIAERFVAEKNRRRLATGDGGEQHFRALARTGKRGGKRLLQAVRRITQRRGNRTDSRRGFRSCQRSGDFSRTAAGAVESVTMAAICGRNFSSFPPTRARAAGAGLRVQRAGKRHLHKRGLEARELQRADEIRALCIRCDALCGSTSLSCGKLRLERPTRATRKRCQCCRR